MDYFYYCYYYLYSLLYAVYDDASTGSGVPGIFGLES